MTEVSRLDQGAPRVSVVITCYNYERYVGLALESVMAQTHRADEIIVVDDGSTDGSAGIIARYRDNVRVLFQENAGNIESLNRGYLASSGEIVLFLDADDILLPGAIESVISHWRPGLSKIQYNLDIIDANGVYLNRRFCAFPKDYSFKKVKAEFLQTGTYIWPVMSGNAYSRLFLSEVMPLQAPVGSDGVLNSIAPLYGDVVTLPRPFGQYRLHGANISRHDRTGRPLRHPDFAKRIEYRLIELEILRKHCQITGVKVATGNILDNEIVFVNYKISARKLGQSYSGAERDSYLFLWSRGMVLSAKTGHRMSMILGHMLWFSALSLAPKALAKKLIHLRYSRADLFARLRRRFRLTQTSIFHFGSVCLATFAIKAIAIQC